ncbi:MAG TPA: hypothetical protein VNB29_05135 [Chthoniobacterales bacterium]|nr:hypothetical protein [Chthoniobacterales bacterium]
MLAVAFAFPASAKSHRPRFGFQHFGARYTGGYSIVAGENTLAGPADIRIRAAKNGQSATVIWANTFYTTRSGYRVVLRWNFLPDGRVVGNSMDPRAAQAGGSGTFVLDGNRPVQFSGLAGDIRAEGQLRLIGGGALSITVTLTGTPDGDVTYSFSGGRKR